MTLKKHNHRTINNHNLINHINSKDSNYYSRNCENNNFNMSANDNSLNNSLINFIQQKSNNSFVNINISKKNANNNFSYDKNNVNRNSNINKIRRDMGKKDIHNKIYYNQIYNNQNKQKKIYLHKKYNPDDGKNLSSIDSINSSAISSIGENTNNNIIRKEKKIYQN